VDVVPEGTQPDPDKVRRLERKLSTLFNKLTFSSSRSVLYRLDRLADGRGSMYHPRRWCAEEMQSCYKRLAQISKVFARTWRNWALEMLRTDFNRRSVILNLSVVLDYQRWTEEDERASRISPLWR
jgi:hypothetical protein